MADDAITFEPLPAGVTVRCGACKCELHSPVTSCPGCGVTVERVEVVNDTDQDAYFSGLRFSPTIPPGRKQ